MGAACWWRVWAHVGGHEVPIVDRAEFGPGDRDAWIMASFFASEDAETSIPETPILWTVRQSGDTSQRGCRLAPAAVERFLASASAHAGKAWVSVAWGAGAFTLDATRMALVPVGDRRHRWFAKLPPTRVAARARVRLELQKVQADVRKFLKRPDRRRLDHYATELAVYLLRHGQGAALPPHTEEETFAMLYDDDWTGDNYKNSRERRAVRADYDRALQLIATPPGQPAD